MQDLITGVPRASAGAATPPHRSRGHRRTEDRRHYVRDVTRGEDAKRTRSGSGPQVLAAVRDLALSRLRLDAARLRDLLVCLYIL